MKMQNLLILGAGQYGIVVQETALATGSFESIAFLDDNNPTALGKLDSFERYLPRFANAFVAMGNPQLRKEWLGRLERAGFLLPTLIHPAAYVSPTAKLGRGTIVEPMAVVNAGAEVGQGCLLCAGALVNHNSFVQDWCQIDCGAVVPARATVPSGTKVLCGSRFESL